MIAGIGRLIFKIIAHTCCTFNFSDFYGKKIGNGFIEIHHIKPIFKFEGDDFVKTLTI